MTGPTALFLALTVSSASTALTGCGPQEPVALPEPVVLTPPTTSPTSPAADAGDGADPTEGPLDADAVLAAVDAAGSVRIAIGNLNPPPTTVLVQDFSSADGDLEMTVQVEEGVPVATLRRVDGQVLLSAEGGAFQQVPPIDPEDDSLVTRVLRTTPATELEVMLGTGATPEPAADLVEEVPGAVSAYRLVVQTDDLPPPGLDAFASLPWQGLPRRLPVTVWLGADLLPLRVEARYSDPLNGIEGTGTARIDYSEWGEPVGLD